MTIVLLDLKLPDHGGLSLVPLLRERVPDAGIVVLTQNDDYRSVLEAIQLGVVGLYLEGHAGGRPPARHPGGS